MLPRFFDICHFEVVRGELLLVRQTPFAILHFPARFRVARPYNVVDRIHVLQERAQALQSVGEFGGDGIEVDAAALLEVGELGDLQAIEHHLPSDAPRAESWRLPVVFFELYVVLAEVDADCAQRFEVEFLDVFWRRLQDYLQLEVLEEAIGIFPVTAVGGAPRWLWG